MLVSEGRSRPGSPRHLVRRLPGMLAAILLVAACWQEMPAPTQPPPVGTHPDPSPTPLATGTEAAPTATTVIPPATAPTATPSLAQLIGQRLVVSMRGTVPSDGLLGRISRGEVGGIILFRANVVSEIALREVARQLLDAAVAGGQPPLLILVDQEGGGVKRIEWAPPWLSAREMGRDGRSAVAFDQGSLAGAALRDLGVNVNLAPVGDVPESGSASFMEQADRVFSTDPDRAAALSTAFARGLEAGGVIPTMKHFPGIGLAATNTDTTIVVIDVPAERLEAGLTPFRSAIADAIPMIMLSNATYPAFDPESAASWSAAIAGGLLRDRLGFEGVTITDSLDGTAHARGLATIEVALKAAAAGVDLILTTGSEGVTARIHEGLVAAAMDGTLSTESLAVSYGRIVALKAGA